MHNFDRNDERALRHLDDLALEEIRVAMLADGDPRIDTVIRELVMRAVPAIESVCRTRGNHRGLTPAQTGKTIEDATARLLLRLGRQDRLAPVTALAAEIAAACVDAQEPAASATPPRLAPRQPDLRLADQLGDALVSGRLRRNDWRNS
jgi:hypothetical protein